ncbi:3,4-dihydroxy-2-butanone-4-phosphate synthase [Rhodococcoides kyotonense]|uniref:3,4-dihydroxy-2-butanone-4-phosphate synthase n=1 Tax=Rhodococcoides kyotonense TaxID=398843 RepID=A0A239DUG3_9NOCA|nr:3,4-dihydroxy-2-butanone-4-phosphate synthase [Rhodococcus kyotonensis]SNS35578.1 3,4-dihydroxy 2-butanone 4-phosphate synthase / GTP cyclohydrolase II [Rhodococcus kyotonensis]
MSVATQLFRPTRFDSARRRAHVALSQGAPIVVVDDLRGTGCDLVVDARTVDVSSMAHLIRFGSGFVCVTVDEETCERLDLPPVEWSQRSSFYIGNPRVSVDVSHGTTTGISGFDRAATARALARPAATAGEFTRPGHLVPVLADGRRPTRPDLIAELVGGPAVFTAMEPSDIALAHDATVVRQGDRVVPVIRMSDFAYF